MFRNFKIDGALKFGKAHVKVHQYCSGEFEIYLLRDRGFQAYVDSYRIFLLDTLEHVVPKYLDSIGMDNWSYRGVEVYYQGKLVKILLPTY